MLKTIIMGAGLLLIYNGYQEGRHPEPVPVPSPSPTPSPAPAPGPLPSPSPLPGPGTTLHIIVSPPEQLAPAPNPALLPSAAPLYAALKGKPDDALKLSRAYKAWADLIATDATLKTTQQFQDVYTTAMQVLLAKHSIAGKYPYQLTYDPILASFKTAGLADGEGLSAATWSPAAAQAAKDAFNLISHEAFRAYADSVTTK